MPLRRLGAVRVPQQQWTNTRAKIARNGRWYATLHYIALYSIAKHWKSEFVFVLTVMESPEESRVKPRGHSEIKEKSIIEKNCYGIIDNPR